MATRVSQTTKEVVASGVAIRARAIETGLEVASSSTSPAGVAIEAGLEVLSSSSSPAGVAIEAGLEVLSRSSSPAGVAIEVGLELLVEVYSALIWGLSPIDPGDVPGPTVSLEAPPPIPILYKYPSGGAKVSRFKVTPSDADLRLRELEMEWERYVQAESRGVPMRGLGRLTNGLRWLALGRQRKPFFRQGSIVTPAPAAGNVAVVSLEVPEGYYGWLGGFWWAYTGTGYVEGSSDIEWRIRIQDWFPSGYGKVRFQLGSPTDPLALTGMIPIRSRQVVQLQVLIRNDSGAIQVGTSRIIGGIVGWYYEPEGGRGSISW